MMAVAGRSSGRGGGKVADRLPACLPAAPFLCTLLHCVSCRGLRDQEVKQVRKGVV